MYVLFLPLVFGLLAATVGVAGDHWANGKGFPIEVLGLFTMMIGQTMYGVALRRIKIVPAWLAWMFIGCGPGTLAFTGLIGHLPSGPTFPFAIVWLIVGGMLLLNRGVAPARPGSAEVSQG